MEKDPSLRKKTKEKLTGSDDGEATAIEKKKKKKKIRVRMVLLFSRFE